MTSKSKKIAWIVSFLALAVILFFVSPIEQFFSINTTINADNEDNLKFDKKLWTVHWDKGKNGENDRHYMLSDLTENHLKLGMDSAEIKNLLGEPERDFGFSYNLGLYKSGFDPTFLLLDFDDKGKLKSIRVETI